MKKDESANDFNILLVDDDLFILSGISRVLEKAGFRVVKVNSGEKAFELLKKESFDLVLTDLVMGQISGVEVLVESKNLQPEAMVIILTGYADMKAAVNAIKFGADDFMIKPAESEEIYFRVKRCLENKTLRDKVKQNTLELEKVNECLGLDIIERTMTEDKLNLANAELKKSLAKLTFAQDKLVQSEKLAALGRLVAGITHEINTPIGIGITASSFIEQLVEKMRANLEKEDINKKEFERKLKIICESAEMITTNLERAVKLVSNFKMISVDQESEKPRSIVVCDYIQDLVSGLSIEFKNSRHIIEVNCAKDIVFNSRPGALAQIISNFIINTMVHAFDGIDCGRVVLDISTKNGMLIIECSDNGVGMSSEAIKQVFDPFYTTKREEGGSGLGMYIVYSLVTNALNGTIKCESELNKGSCFSICVPLNN